MLILNVCLLTPASCARCTSSEVVLDGALGVRVLEQYTSDVTSTHVHRGQVAHFDVQTQRLAAGLHDCDGLRVQPFRDQHPAPLVHPEGGEEGMGVNGERVSRYRLGLKISRI